MGFFKDMGLIGKVYNHLKAIETIIDSGKSSTLRQGDAFAIRQHLNELIKISSKGNRTIDYATFEFEGKKQSLGEITFVLDNFLKMYGY